MAKPVWLTKSFLPLGAKLVLPSHGNVNWKVAKPTSYWQLFLRALFHKFCPMQNLINLFHYIWVLYQKDLSANSAKLRIFAKGNSFTGLVDICTPLWGILWLNLVEIPHMREYMLCAHEVATPRETSGCCALSTRSLWSSKGRTVCERIPRIKWWGTHKKWSCCWP